MSIRDTALAVATALPLLAERAATTKPPQMERFGLYVAAEDVPASARFYEKLFGIRPQRATPTFVGFDLHGALLAIASREAFRLPAETGSRVRPYIRVTDIDAAFQHARAVAPGQLESGSVIDEGAFRFFRIADPEGNVVELLTISAAPTVGK